MSQTTFYISTATDNVRVSGGGTSYPPPATSYDHAPVCNVLKYYDAGPIYGVYVACLRWDTSGLGAGAVISAATLHLQSWGIENADSRTANVEWYDPANWPIDLTDYSTSVGTTAGTLAMSSWPALGNYFDITLSNLSNINKTGYTGMRLGLSGGQPTGHNNGTFVAYDGVNQQNRVPQLVVTYTVGYAEKVMGDPGSSLSDIVGVASSSCSKVLGIT